MISDIFNEYKKRKQYTLPKTKLAVDGHNITKQDDLINYIGQNKIAGDNITLAVYRNGHVIDLKATITARPSLIPFLTTRSVTPSMPHPPIRPPTIPIPHPR